MPNRLTDCVELHFFLEGTRMSISDEITKERQRLNEALARLDAQRERLSCQLSELDATERVLASYSKGPRASKNASVPVPTAAAKTAAPARSGGRQRITTAKADSSKRASSSLGDKVLALATGKTQQEIAAACKGARPNHVGMALARHKRTGRIEERDGKLFATHAAGMG
jgi:hypothetical protein